MTGKPAKHLPLWVNGCRTIRTERARITTASYFGADTRWYFGVITMVLTHTQMSITIRCLSLTSRSRCLQTATNLYGSRMSKPAVCHVWLPKVELLWKPFLSINWGYIGIYAMFSMEVSPWIFALSRRCFRPSSKQLLTRWNDLSLIRRPYRPLAPWSKGDSIWAQKAKEGLSFRNVPTADGPRWAHRETGQYLIRIEAQVAHLEVFKSWSKYMFFH